MPRVSELPPPPSLIYKKGIGIWGCTLFNSILCKIKLQYIYPSIYTPNEEETKKNKNKNNIYIKEGGGVTPIPPAPLNPKKILKSKKIIQITEAVAKKSMLQQKLDRDCQFYDSPECVSIKCSHTKEKVYKFLAENPGTNFKKIIDEFGVGSLKLKNILLRENKIITKKGGYYITKLK